MLIVMSVLNPKYPYWVFLKIGSPETTSMMANYDNVWPYSQRIIWPQNSWFIKGCCFMVCISILGIFSIMPCFQFGNDAPWYPADRSHGSKLNIHTCSINEDDDSLFSTIFPLRRAPLPVQSTQCVRFIDYFIN